MRLSIVIPVYNEKATLRAIVRRVLDAPIDLDRELIIVDDYSTDGTRDLYDALPSEFPDADIRVFQHDRNRGKGAALRTGFAQVRGDIIIIQDADLEYSPTDYPRLLKPILDGRADVVYGSRFIGGQEHRVLYFWHYMGNRFLTLLSNMFTDLNLTDMETCYKVFRSEVLAGIRIRSDRFGVEPELTAKVARGRWRIYETGISYSGRSYEEGKKITWRDGVKAIFAIVRFAFSD
ncbi:MAG: glycosyltransferase family 2 protein [Planctomycetota bacterium]|nr:MAG: glycosyltransferase family 2 protein [Planctomycetota bacterium]